MEKLRAIHKEQTASRRSQPSSRIASKGELSFPWNLLRKWFTLVFFTSLSHPAPTSLRYSTWEVELRAGHGVALLLVLFLLQFYIDRKRTSTSRYYDL